MNEQSPQVVTPSLDLSLAGEEHVRVYRETNGERGYIWNGVPILLLTTTGHKSGESRTIPIIFNTWANGWAIIASKGGAPNHPAWYLNLQADSRAKVQVKGDVFDVVARTAQSPEREEIWREAIKTWPSYDLYQQRTSREIPVVVLEKV